MTKEKNVAEKHATQKDIRYKVIKVALISYRPPRPFRLWWKMSRTSLGLLPLAITKLLWQCLGRRSINWRWSIFRQSLSNIQKQLHLLLLSLRTVNLKDYANLSQSIPHIWPSPETSIFSPLFLQQLTTGDFTSIFIFQIKKKNRFNICLTHSRARATIRINGGKFKLF